MIPNVMRDLEAIRDENLKLLAAPDDDISQVQKWVARRELIFTHLQEGNLHWSLDERAISLVKEILELDAKVLARLKQNLTTLSQRSAAAVQMQQALGGTARFYPSVLLQRVA